MRDLENRPSAVDRAHMKRSLGCLGRNVTIFSHRGIFWGFTRRNNNKTNTGRFKVVPLRGQMNLEARLPTISPTYSHVISRGL